VPDSHAVNACSTRFAGPGGVVGAEQHRRLVGVHGKRRAAGGVFLTGAVEALIVVRL
jgi:hypothetical protein